MSRPGEPLGVILAGGRGRRMGGAKATVGLAGRSLIAYPLTAVQQALREVVVVAKPSTRLPPLTEVAVWREPERPQHPLVGIVTALERARGRSVLVCAADMPFVTVAGVRRLVRADRDAPPTAAVVAAIAGERLEPLLAVYRAAAIGPLARALEADPGVSLTAAVRALHPITLALAPEDVLSINRPEDLVAAEARILRS